MTQSSSSRKGAAGIRWCGILVLVLAVVVLAAALFVAPARAAPSTSSGSEQWAFGGHASVSFSCKDSACSNDSTFVGSYSLSYSVGWVVIYTRTNVSPTQTMIEGQAALNANAHLAFSETLSGATESLSASLSGMETAAGFTNLTAGSVSLTSAGNLTTWTSPALAIMNAASVKAFNFSGSFSAQSPNGSGTANFDLGGHEASSVAFTPSLGIVPADPQPGDMWSAVAAFTASGSWVSGYSLSVAGAPGGSTSDSNWTARSVAHSGVLGVNGTDLGAIPLYDNYTSITAQAVYLDFGSGPFTLSDGWLIMPSGLYSDLLSGLGETGGSTGSPSNETAYYQGGSGFVGAGIAGSASIPVGATGSSPVSLSLQAGPEPVGVAQQQYNAITSPAGSSGGFPWIWFVVAVVVVLVVLVGAVWVLRRSRGHRPPPPAWTSSTVSPPDVPGGPSAGVESSPPPPSPPQ